MPKYHINPKTGNPNICKAKLQCPFGGESEHYDSSDEARKAFEKTQETFIKAEGPFDSLSFEELERLEVERFEEKLAKKEPYADGEEYERRREYIRRMIKKYPSSQKLNTHSVKGKSVYTEERLAQHEKVLQIFEERYAHVPNEGKIILTGGAPGSGKTTVVRDYANIDVKNYATVNPDDVKEVMFEQNMGTEVPGLTQLETSDIIQYESIVLTEKLLDRLASKKKNLIIDKTMNHGNPIVKNLDKMKALGYDENITTVFADVDPDTAYHRIRNRHLTDLNKFVVEGKGAGGRYVPGNSITATRTDSEHYKSKNAETLVELYRRGALGEKPLVFDTNEESPRQVSFEDFEKPEDD